MVLSSIFLTPILSRIYDPAVYGVFAAYNSIISTTVLISLAGIPSAMIVSDNKKDFYNLFVIAITSVLIFSVLSVLVVWIIYGLNIIQQPAGAKYLILIPTGLLINGILGILPSWNIKRENFVSNSFVDISNNVISRLVSIGLGLLNGYNLFGLILGSQFGRIIGNFFLIRKTILYEYGSLKRVISLQNMRGALKRAKNYPKFILPSQLVNNLRGLSPIIFFGFKFGQATLGSYSMTIGLLNLPIQVISNSLSSIFLKRGLDIYNDDPEQLKPFVGRLWFLLFIVGIVPFSILVVFGEGILTFFLGREWSDSAKFASALSPFFFTQLMFSPVGSLYLIYKKEKAQFIWNSMNLVVIIVALITGFILNSALHTVIILSISSTITYILGAGYIFRIGRHKFIMPLILYYLLFFLLVLVFHNLKFLV